MIRVRGLRRGFGGQVVLDGLHLRVDEGERVALLGPNGAGKTTLFRCVLGIIGFRGEIEIAGHAVDRAGREARRKVGYVPQTAPAYPMSLRSFLGFFSDLRGVPVSGAVRRLEELGLSLEEAGGKSLRELSGGMLQKAVLALALSSEAPVLLLDEPTASLDPASRREFLRGVREVDVGRTLLFASHRFDEIEALADRVLVLHRGGIVFDGSPEELRERTGLGSSLWLRMPAASLDRAAEELRRDPAVRHVARNGMGLRADVEPASAADVIAALRRRGLEVQEIRSRPPAPEEMMARVLELAGEAEAGAGADR